MELPSCKGDAIELKEKWLSILCHIVKKYNLGKAMDILNERTLAYFALESVVSAKTLLNDLAHLAKFNYTGQLQVFHALYNN